MATVPSGLHSAPQHHSDSNGRSDRQLRHDRTVAVLVIAGLLALTALMIWLASLGGSVPSENYYDYWMMP